MCSGRQPRTGVGEQRRARSDDRLRPGRGRRPMITSRSPRLEPRAPARTIALTSSAGARRHRIGDRSILARSCRRRWRSSRSLPSRVHGRDATRACARDRGLRLWLRLSSSLQGVGAPFQLASVAYQAKDCTRQETDSWPRRCPADSPRRALRADAAPARPAHAGTASDRSRASCCCAAARFPATTACRPACAASLAS